MYRLRYLAKYGPVPDYGDDLTLFHAFVACLSPEEATRALDLSFEQQYRKRSAILRRIIRDMQSDGFKEYHRTLLDALIEALSTVPAPKRQSCGYCLSELYRALPDSERHRLLASFLPSPYVTIRRRGYKVLRHSWNPDFAPAVEAAWLRFSDSEATRLLIDHSPLAFLGRNLNRLVQTVGTSWDLRKLFLRLARAEPKALERLYEIDEGSYVYVAAKLGHRLRSRDALAIFERHVGTEDSGLLIWCFGQMGLWRVLQNLRGRLDHLTAARYAHLSGNA